MVYSSSSGSRWPWPRIDFLRRYVVSTYGADFVSFSNYNSMMASCAASSDISVCKYSAVRDSPLHVLFRSVLTLSDERPSVEVSAHVF